MSKTSLVFTQNTVELDSIVGRNGLPKEREMRYEYTQRDSGKWSHGKLSIDELSQQSQSKAEIVVVFLPEIAEVIKQPAHEELFRRYEIPSAFTGSVVHDASGYFGCQVSTGEKGDLESCSSQTRLLVKQPLDTIQYLSKADDINSSYIWHRLGVFIKWTPFNKAVVLCFGLPPSLQQSLQDLSQIHLEDPFSFYTTFLEKVLTFYDTAIWSWRDLVRDLEQNRPSPRDPKPDYTKMHEIARHIIHCSETVATATEAIYSLIQEHEIFFLEHPSFPAEVVRRSSQTRRILRSHTTLFKCLHLRSKALESRLTNEMTLAFNTVAQYDSHIAVKIGEATQVDSAAMRTISVLGLVFLPGTFISALFSMSFFDYTPGNSTEPGTWSMSEKFWIYWAVAVPLTCVTIGSWFLRQKMAKQRS